MNERRQSKGYQPERLGPETENVSIWSNWGFAEGFLRFSVAIAHMLKMRLFPELGTSAMVPFWRETYVRHAGTATIGSTVCFSGPNFGKDAK